jgi:hypothetical protein
MDSCEVKGRKFKFVIPSVWDGCAISDFLSAYDTPFGAAALLGLRTVSQHMSPEQLETFMKICLKYCVEQIEGNPRGVPVIDAEGGIGITGATSQMLTKLTAQYTLFFVEYWQTENG